MLIVGDSFNELVSKVDVWLQHIYRINVLLHCALSLHEPNVKVLLSSLTVDWLLDAKQSLDVMRYIGVLDFKTRPDAYNHDIHGNGCVTEFIPTPVGKTLSSTCSRTDYIIHARCVSPEFATDN